MCKNNGILLSVAGMSLLLSALHDRNPRWVFLGIAGLALAEMARSSNPMMPYGFAWCTAMLFPFFRNRFRTAVLLSVFALLLSWGLPRVLNSLYGYPGSGQDSNVGYTLLGLARGNGWTEARRFGIKRYQDRRAAQPSAAEAIRSGQHFDEGEVNRDLLGLVIPTIREKPGVFVNSLQEGFLEATHQFLGQTMRAVGLHRFQWSWGHPYRYLFFFGGIVLLTGWLFRWHRDLAGLAATAFVLGFTFAPFVYKDAGWRILSTQFAGLVLPAVLVPLGLRRLLSRVGQAAPVRAVPSPPARPEVWFPAALVVFVALSFPYLSLSRLLIPTDHPTTGIIVTLDADAAPGWTGPDRATIPPDMLYGWFARMCRDKALEPIVRPFEQYLRTHLADAVELRYEKDKCVLLVRNRRAGEAFSLATDGFFQASWLQCRVLEDR